MSWAIWITGIPGSGKSVLARAASVELRARGYPPRILELDEIRKTLTPEPRDTDTERDVVYRALGWMARLMTEAGVPVIVDATAHRRVWRDLARAAIPHFAEVQIECPLEVARERERSRLGGNAPRGISERAGRPGATIPGLDVPYEPALAPELVIDSARESVAEAAHRIADLAFRLSAGTEGPALATAGWAIWITGRPGTGKTTVTSRVVQALATRAVPVRVLSLDEVRSRLLPGRQVPEADREILHRALVYATKLLTEAGTAVIIDSRRAPTLLAPGGPRTGPVLRGGLPRVSGRGMCRPRARRALGPGRHGAGTPAADRGRFRSRHHPGLRGIPPAGAHRPYRRGRPLDGRTKDPVPGPAPAPIARDRARDAVSRKGTPAMSRLKRILHPSDFSRASGGAFTKALELAKDHRAELVLVHAFALPLQMMGEAYIPPDAYAQIEASKRAWAKKGLDKLIAKAKKAGVRARGLVLEGTPYDRITRAARSNRTDLIVMGTHGRTGLTKLFWSVAARVLSTATCPVMTVRGK